MYRALIIASYGSSVPETRAGLAALEKTLTGAAPGYSCLRIFTSPIIRRVLAERGEHVPGLTEALEHLRRGGARRVVVQPTHLLYGAGYGELEAEALAMADSFESLATGRPLLADGGSIRAFAARLSRNCPAAEGGAIVFMGHGTEHPAGTAACPALQTALRLAGRNDIYIGVMNGRPGLADVIRQLGAGGPRQVRLAPLLLSAGTHVRRELTGEWKAHLERAGHTVRCSFAGLCELPWVREMYREKLLGILPAE